VNGEKRRRGASSRARRIVSSLVAVSALLAVAAPTDAREPRTLDGPPVGERVRAVAVGGGTACAIRADRSLACWDYEEDAPLDARPPSGRFLAVSLGETDNACGIRTNHRLACWDNLLVDAPMAPKGEFAAVALVDDDACGIRADQTLECWGEYGTGPPPTGTFTSLVADPLNDAFCALRTDRTVECWNISDPAPPPPGEFTDLAFLDAMAAVCGIRPDSTVTCWEYFSGSGLRAELTMLETLLGRVRAIGGECAIRADRSLICFGWSDDDEVESLTIAKSFKAVDADCAIRTDDTLFCVGVEPPATDMAPPTAPSKPTDLFWNYVLLTISGALGAGAMVVRLGRPAGSGRPRLNDYLDIGAGADLKSCPGRPGPTRRVSSRRLAHGEIVPVRASGTGDRVVPGYPP
jgi:hypothetical protein